ncbi:hypothetical protein [Pseudoxanthomonas sp. JBR18]|uniref:hypothetical protein n=1 Tax=Pseudoxanthomonas sp. JBR18 TaxID=2969308 RepID=UPI002305DD15|nr:hypothetical protein [Pseudoxanthomonas sp. JBR18]WCE05829.1 hypothetical protein PJ250_07740 [Pseudoxanthomonas sp. JBR18]
MKTVLSDLDVLVTSSYVSLDSIFYESKTNRCTVLASDSHTRYQLIFDDTIAFRMMDEREMYEFWSSNIEMVTSIEGAALQKVEAGGWQGADDHIRSSIEDGFFCRTPGRVAEYLMVTGYECLNIISLQPLVTAVALQAPGDEV